MARTRRQFARLDLSDSLVEEVDVFAIFTPTEERVALLEQFRDKHAASEFPSFLPLVRTFSYTRSEVQHHVTVVVYRDAEWDRASPDREDSIRFVVNYDTREVVAKGRKRSSLTERAMIDLLVELGAAKDTWGRVDFRVPGVSPDDLWFPLPTRLASERDPEALFEMVSIRGARLEPKDQIGNLYRFTLSHFGDGVAEINLWLDLDQAGPDMGRLALNRANKFLPDLIAHSENLDDKRSR